MIHSSNKLSTLKVAPLMMSSSRSGKQSRYPTETEGVSWACSSKKHHSCYKLTCACECHKVNQ